MEAGKPEKFYSRHVIFTPLIHAWDVCWWLHQRSSTLVVSCPSTKYDDRYKHYPMELTPADGETKAKKKGGVAFRITLLPPAA